jgi:hypothetical protein
MLKANKKLLIYTLSPTFLVALNLSIQKGIIARELVEMTENKEVTPKPKQIEITENGFKCDLLQELSDLMNLYKDFKK